MVSVKFIHLNEKCTVPPGGARPGVASDVSKRPQNYSCWHTQRPRGFVKSIDKAKEHIKLLSEWMFFRVNVFYHFHINENICRMSTNKILNIIYQSRNNVIMVL